MRTVWLSISFSALISCGENPAPPNIVFIMSDDHAYQAISAYGHDLNHTPNIDRIAKEGAIFNKGFVTNSICAPSRAVVLTGQGHYYNPDFIENGVTRRIRGYVTNITTGLALDWLENKRDRSKPFLLLYQQKAPHRNWKPEEKYLSLFDDKIFEPPAKLPVYEDEKYQSAREAMHEKLLEIREKYGDSDELNRMHLENYLNDTTMPHYEEYILKSIQRF